MEKEINLKRKKKAKKGGGVTRKFGEFQKDERKKETKKESMVWFGYLVYSVGRGSRVHQLLLCRGVRLP